MASDEITWVTGHIKLYFEDKGFGFIQTEDLGEVFLHVTKLEAGYGTPREGDAVRFNPVPSVKKPGTYEATRVGRLRNTP